MIGDGITDLEAVQVSGGADLFIGYGGAVQRESVKSNCEWYITDWKELIKNLKQFKVGPEVESKLPESFQFDCLLQGRANMGPTGG